jgi:hypothetical protein
MRLFLLCVEDRGGWRDIGAKTLPLFILLLVVWEQSNLLRSWKWENQQLTLAIRTLQGVLPFGAPQWQANPLGMSYLVKVERVWLYDDLKVEGCSLRTAASQKIADLWLPRRPIVVYPVDIHDE